MGNWKNRDSKLQQRRTIKQQRKFYEDAGTSKKRKDIIREQRQEKQDEYDNIMDDS
jgi:hypothetical protein